MFVQLFIISLPLRLLVMIIAGRIIIITLTRKSSCVKTHEAYHPCHILSVAHPDRGRGSAYAYPDPDWEDLGGGRLPMSWYLTRISPPPPVWDNIGPETRGCPSLPGKDPGPASSGTPDKQTEHIASRRTSYADGNNEGSGQIRGIRGFSFGLTMSRFPLGHSGWRYCLNIVLEIARY